jgi:hypothetical protein
MEALLAYARTTSERPGGPCHGSGRKQRSFHPPLARLNLLFGPLKVFVKGAGIVSPDLEWRCTVTLAVQSYGSHRFRKVTHRGYETLPLEQDVCWRCEMKIFFVTLSPSRAVADASLGQTPQEDCHDFFVFSFAVAADNDLCSWYRSCRRCAVAAQLGNVRGIERQALPRRRFRGRHRIRRTLLLWPARFAMRIHYPRSARSVLPREDNLSSLGRWHAHHAIDCRPACPNQIAEHVRPHSRQQGTRLRVVSEIPLRSAQHFPQRSAPRGALCS